MVRYLFYTIGDLTYQSPLVRYLNPCRHSINFNSLKHSGYCMNYLLEHQNRILPRKCLCTLVDSHNKRDYFPNSFNQPVFVLGTRVGLQGRLSITSQL